LHLPGELQKSNITKKEKITHVKYVKHQFLHKQHQKYNTETSDTTRNTKNITCNY